MKYERSSNRGSRPWRSSPAANARSPATLMRLGLQKSDGTARASNRYGSGTIRKVQATLNARGYKAVAVNGVLDQSTQSALRAFQKSEGLKITGRPNPRTLAHLGITEQSASAGSSRRR